MTETEEPGEKKEENTSSHGGDQQGADGDSKSYQEDGVKISFTKEDQKRVPGSYRDARRNMFGGRKSDEGRNSDREVEETDPTADRRERNADEAAVEEDKKDFRGPSQKKLDSDIAFQ
jgi:hypothetical protein